MKKYGLAILVTVLNVVMFFASHPQTVKAQNPEITPWMIEVSGTALHTQCPVKAGVTRECIAFDGHWVSENGAAYYKLAPSGGAGVTSFNGLTGAITSATALIKFADLTAKPTGLNCSTATHSNNGINCPVGTLTFQ